MSLQAEVLLATFAIAAALIAGVFYAFSTFVMNALSDLPPSEGIRAMQRINIVVLNPLFMIPFFGTAILGINACVLGGGPGALVGTILYALGTLGVTIAANVPLNNALAALNPDSPAAHDFWKTYVRRWTRWNHIRSAAALAASAGALLTEHIAL